MLKTRVIPTLLLKDFGLVKGIGFDSWRRTGGAMQAIKIYGMREVDELILLDIAATPAGRGPDFAQIDELADSCFMPLTVGGGVRSVADIGALLAVGADKVAINSAAIADPSILRLGAEQYGAQCIVAAIDVMRHPDGRCEVYSRCGTEPTALDPVAWARQVEALGAGEILLTSIDRDGTMRGYDLDLTASVTSAVSIPVIASGGAGSYEHMVEAIAQGRAAAVAAASIYHFTEMTPREAKRHIREAGFPVRL